MTKRYPFPQKKVFQVLFGLYLFSILYFCRVSQVSYYLLGFYKSQFLSLSITLLALLVFLIYQRKHLLQIVFNYRIALAILFAAAILIPMCVKKDWQMMYFSILLSILMGVFFSYFVSCAQAGKGFCVVMATLAAYSLAAFLHCGRWQTVGFWPLPSSSTPMVGNFTIISWPLYPKHWCGTGILAFSGSLGFTNSFCFWRCISAFTMFNGKSRPLCGCAAVFCV